MEGKEREEEGQRLVGREIDCTPMRSEIEATRGGLGVD